MTGRSLLALLGMVVACTTSHAQPPGDTFGQEVTRQWVVRLPPVDGTSLLSNQFLAEEDTRAKSADESSNGHEIGVTDPTPDPAEKLWDGNFELGFDGTAGPTNTLNFRFGFEAERKTSDHVLSLDLDYNKKTNEGEETTNRAFLDWRFERLWEESRWSSFVHGTVDYDEFQAFDVRVAVDIGLAYRLIKSDRTTLAARAGGGFSHELGGPDDEYVPEAVFGLKFEHKLTKRQKFTFSTEYAPDVTAMNDFRLNSQAAWEAVIDEATNLSLKLGALNRYDSTPHEAERNAVDYSAVLMWSF